MAYPFRSNWSKEPGYDRDHQPIGVLTNSVGFDLFGAVRSTTPLAIEPEIASEAHAAELCRHRFTVLDGGHDLVSSCSALGHTLGGMWVDPHGHGACSCAEYR